jgi:hypothetical protein
MNKNGVIKAIKVPQKFGIKNKLTLFLMTGY